AAVVGHGREGRLPGRAAEEVVGHDEERVDAVVLARVADPAYDRLGIPRPHRAPHDVLHAAVRAGERAAARGVDRRHVGRGKAAEVGVVDGGELRLGDERHGDLARAGLGADALAHAVARSQLAAQVVVEDVGPDGPGLAHHGGDAAALEEGARLGIAAHVEAAEEDREAGAAELERQVAPARVWFVCTPARPTITSTPSSSAFSWMLWMVAGSTGP